MSGSQNLSHLIFPRIGVGTGAWGPPYPPVPQEQANALVRMVLNRPGAFFDTAPLYGGGIAEKWLGQSLQGVPRSSYVLETKTGYVLHREDGYRIDLSRANLLHSVEESLARLQQERLDIIHLHDPDCCLSDALDIAFPALVALREQGLVSAVGAGMNQWEMLMEFARNADFDCFLLAGRYTLLEQGSLELLDLCYAKGIYLFLGGIYNTGILATGAVAGARYNYQTAPVAVLERVARIEAVCARYQVPLKAAALQFPFAHPAVRSLVVGMQSETEFLEAESGLAFPIPADFWQELRDGNLIDEQAPVPGA